jgi:hypothetical protein
MSDDAGIPRSVRLPGRLLWWLWRPAWRGYWIRYWQSEGISEETQMQWAEEADAENESGLP